MDGGATPLSTGVRYVGNGREHRASAKILPGVGAARTRHMVALSDLRSRGRHNRDTEGRWQRKFCGGVPV